MRAFHLLLLSGLIVLTACTDKGEVTAQTETEAIKPDEKTLIYSIVLTVESGKEVVIDDPFSGEIERISEEARARRAYFLSNMKQMTREERAAYGEYRDAVGQQVLDLETQRRRYIAEQMKAHDSLQFRLTTQQSN